MPTSPKTSPTESRGGQGNERPADKALSSTIGCDKGQNDGHHIRHRLTCTIKEACAVSGLGRTTFYELIKSGEVTVISIGRRRLVQVPSLLKALRMEGY
jgi:excisionase family DNA binding protein